MKTARITISNVAGYLKHRPQLAARIRNLYARHCAACRTLSQDVTPWNHFAFEIISAPPIAQEDLLRPEPPPRYASTRTYGQYYGKREPREKEKKMGRPRVV